MVGYASAAVAGIDELIDIVIAKNAEAAALLDEELAFKSLDLNNVAFRICNQRAKANSAQH